MTKDSDEDWIQIKKRLRQARKEESRLSMISAEKIKLQMGRKEPRNQKHLFKPIKAKSTL